MLLAAFSDSDDYSIFNGFDLIFTTQKLLL